MRKRNRNRVRTDVYLVNRHNRTYDHGSRAAAEAYANDVIEQTYQTTVIDEMEDNVTPGYFKAKKAGDLLPTQPLKVKREERTMGWITYCAAFENGLTRYPYSSSSETITAFPSIPNVWPELITDKDIQTIAQSAQARMASDGIDWATSTLELGKTISMLTGIRKSILKLIADILDALKDRRFKSLGELYNAFSSAWLEGRFGWRILYYELKSINDYLDNIGEGHKKFFARESFSNSTTIKSQTFARNSSLSHVVRSDEVTFKVSAKVGYIGIGNLERPGGFNILNTAWEVMPFTVVLDMFFNIQDIILAWAPHSSRVAGYQPGSFLTIEKSAVASNNFEGGYVSRGSVFSASMPGFATRTLIERSVAPARPFSFDFSPELRGLKKVDLFAFMGPIYRAFIK